MLYLYIIFQKNGIFIISRKNHKMVGGRLLKTDKGFSNLKMSQWITFYGLRKYYLSRKSNFCKRYEFAYKYIPALLKNGMDFSQDLSSIRFILNGVEPISAGVCNPFLKEMSVYNLRMDALLNVYGMAESSLAVSFSTPHEKLEYTFFERCSLTIGDHVKRVDGGENSVPIVNVGTALPCCKIRIADENNNILSEETAEKLMMLSPGSVPITIFLMFSRIPQYMKWQYSSMRISVQKCLQSYALIR